MLGTAFSRPRHEGQIIMMATPTAQSGVGRRWVDEFSDWLTGRMKAAELHDEAFVEYVKSIVELDDKVSDDAEKREGLTDFLGGITESSVEPLVEEILKRWAAAQQRIKEDVQQDKIWRAEGPCALFDRPTSPFCT